MEEYSLSEHHPPCDFLWVCWWERSLDPWHPDAFVGIEGVERQMKAAHGGSSRRNGWMATDWCGNPLGFYPDGAKLKYSGIGPRPIERVEGDFCYLRPKNVRDEE